MGGSPALLHCAPSLHCLLGEGRQWPRPALILQQRSSGAQKCPESGPAITILVQIHLPYLFVDFLPPTPLHIKKDQKDFLMYKRCFLHIVPSPPPTHIHPLFPPALNSKTSAPVSRATISEQGSASSDLSKGWGTESWWARPEAQSASWPDTSLIHSSRGLPSPRLTFKVCLQYPQPQSC